MGLIEQEKIEKVKNKIDRSSHQLPDLFRQPENEELQVDTREESPEKPSALGIAIVGVCVANFFLELL